VLFWLSLFISGPSLLAQSFPVAKFTQLNVDNGLSHNYTSDIVQDQQGFIWISTQNGLQRYDGQKLKTFLHDPADTNSIGGNNIYFLEIDQSGQLLIGIRDNYGIDRYDPITEKFIHHHLDFAVDKIGLTQDGGTWLGNGRELRYKAKEEKIFSIHPFPAHPKHSLYKGLWTYSILEDKNNTVWVGTKRGLYQVGANGSAGNWWLPCNEQYISADTTFRIHDILEDRNGNLWLATEQGLFIQSNADQCLLPYRAPKGQPFRFEGKDVSSIELDGDNQLWICTRSEGLGILNLATSVLEYIPPNNGAIPERNLEGIENMFIDRLGSIWLISRGYGIYVYHPKTKQFKWYKYLQNSSSPVLNMAFEDSKGALWLLGEQVELEAPEGTYPSLTKKTLEAIDPPLVVSEAPGGIFWFSTVAGVKRLDVNQGTLQSFFETYQSVGIQPGSNLASAEWVDRKGNFWAGFWGGAAAYIDENDLGNPKFFHCNNKAPASPMGCYLQAITESKDGRIWFGSNSLGLIVYDPKDGSFKNFQKEQGKENWLNNNYVRCILEDRNGILWLGTYGGGMYRFDPNTEQFRHYGIKDGLLDELIEDLELDQNGYIWIAANDELYRFDPMNETFVNFGPDDGLPKTKFISLSTAGNMSGQMYIATEKGYVAFHPDSIHIDTTPPNTSIVKMSRYRSDLADGKPIEEKGISVKKQITLTNEDYLVTFEFAAVTFHKAKQTTIEYKLEGFQNEWIQLEDIRQASFTRLPAGDYTLLVRSANANGFWDKTPARLFIKVLPPWWKTGWAYGAYLLLAGGTLWYFWKRETRRLMLQNQLEKGQLEAAKLRELDQAKTRFFSNISHEFRTPLTVILGMSEEIEKPNLAKQMIQQSGQNLLRLVNQMLDFSKMDAGKLKLRLQSGDLVHYLQYLLESFQSLADHKKVQLSFEPEIDRLEMDFDEEKMQHIVSNLLSNAIKFTPRGGQVKLEIMKLENKGAPQFSNFQFPISISVSDTGIGIPNNQLPRIFERYFQVENAMSKGEPGSGIGLAFTKELVDLMGGEIQVESEVGVGTTFRVILPMAKSDELGPDSYRESFESNTKPEFSSLEISTSQVAGQPTQNSLLLIEDNPEVVAYIRTILQNEYDITVAENGQIGIEKAVELIPDIIISDVMMPVKDGFAVTRFLKNDERTSHIPIILLTAKADAESRLAGLERGADAYLAKPFDKKELSLRLAKLIELRQKLQARYANFAPPEQTAPDEDVKIEDAFLTKINGIIEANLAEAEFGVNELCREAGLSQSQLFRKLKALTGKSSVAYLRRLRLHRAKNLLEKGELNVSEVAYATGFNDPLYFSRVFSQEFGHPPTESGK
jgi:signal transduction histidine kinase/DNA-binding response OmpR family regulator/streptogramin lyase